MKARKPTAAEIAELLAFLPELSTDGFSPYPNAPNEQSGVATVTGPSDSPIVWKLFHVASKDCWCDPEYQSKAPHEMLKDAELISNADIDQIKTMLTYCVRGERFVDGHWYAMIEMGYVRRLLQRLAALASDNA
jgi:hypothetical protein